MKAAEPVAARRSRAGRKAKAAGAIVGPSPDDAATDPRAEQEQEQEPEAAPIAATGGEAPGDDPAPAEVAEIVGAEEPAGELSAELVGAQESPRGRRRRALLVSILAWLLPGFGHLALGQWLRGLAFSSFVAASTAVGVGLHGRLYWFGYGFSAAPIDPLPTVESPLLVFAGSLVSIALGLPAMALRWLVGYQGDVTAPGYEYGTAFLVTAGLMNVLLIFDAWDEAR